MDPLAIVVDALLLAACVALFANSYAATARRARPSLVSRLVLLLFLANAALALVGLVVSSRTPDTFEAGDPAVLPSILLAIAAIYWTSTHPFKRAAVTTAGSIALRAAVVVYLGVILMGM